jgi:hypothetical protein
MQCDRFIPVPRRNVIVLCHVVATHVSLSRFKIGSKSLLGIIRVGGSLDVFLVQEVIDCFLDIGDFGREFGLKISYGRVLRHEFG